MSTMTMYDEMLVIECEMKATGANIHEVNSMLFVYAHNARRFDRLGEQHNKETAERYARYLRQFRATGIVPEKYIKENYR